jgi:hypothetical protein
VKKRRYYAADMSQCHLNLYFSMKFLWGMDFDIDKELKLYYKLFYGPAAKSMEQFFELAMKRWENMPSGKNGHPLKPNEADSLYGVVYTKDITDKLMSYLKSAIEEAPEGSIYRKRVRWIKEDYFDNFYETANAFYKESKTNWIFTSSEQSDVLVPEVDGILSDSVWKNSEIFSMKLSDGPVAPRYKTNFMMKVINNILYIGIHAEDPDCKFLKLNCTSRDSMVFLDDSIEMFICPKVNQYDNFYQIVANVKGAIFDRKVIDGKGDNSWNGNIKVKSTIVDNAWNMELSLPLSDIGINGVNIGDAWRFNICRSKNSGIAENHEMQQWVPTLKKYNDTKNFGKVLFVSNEEFREEFNSENKRWIFSYARTIYENGKASNISAVKEVSKNYKDGFLEWGINFQQNKTKKDHAAIKLSNPGKIDVKNKAWVELRLRNPNKDVHLILAYNYVGVDGKMHNDWLRIDDKSSSPKWKIRAYNLTTDGYFVKKSHSELPMPAKLVYLAVYAQAFPETECKRFVEVDYIRVTDNPVRFVK